MVREIMSACSAPAAKFPNTQEVFWQSSPLQSALFRLPMIYFGLNSCPWEETLRGLNARPRQDYRERRTNNFQEVFSANFHYNSEFHLFFNRTDTQHSLHISCELSTVLRALGEARGWVEFLPWRWSPSVGRWGFPDERSGDEINWEQYLTMKRSDERTNTSLRCNKYLFQILPLFLREIKSYRCRWNLAHYISLLLRGKHESEFGVHYSQPQFYIFIMYICIH